MAAQMNQNILGKPDKNASEISDLKDSVVVLHKHQNCHFMISGLLSHQLSQRLFGKLLSFSSVGVYLTQIVRQQNTDDMIQNLDQIGRCEFSHIPWSILPLPMVFLYFWAKLIRLNHPFACKSKPGSGKHPMLVVFPSTTAILAFF